MKNWILAAMTLLTLPLTPTISEAANTHGHFIAGADFSHAGFFESHGKTYADGGKVDDGFMILKRNGVNCVRLRLFTSSPEQAKKDPYNSINNLEYTIPLAVRAKKAGLSILIDFHYSDSWADPGHQNMPEAWKDLSFDQLEKRMYEYNRDSVAAFKKAGAMPDYIQVGNEITGGMMWPEGRVGGKYETPEQWQKLGLLMKAAIRGIKDASGKNMPRLIVHIDRGGDWNSTKWYFDNLQAQDVKFDIIGESYYPFWHGSLDDLKTCLNNAATRYGKPVVVAETDFPWTEMDSIGKPGEPIVGIKRSKEGQSEFIRTLAKIVMDVPDKRGIGIFWWAAEYLPDNSANLAGFENRSFFDHDGNALPGLKVFGELSGIKR